MDDVDERIGDSQRQKPKNVNPADEAQDVGDDAQPCPAGGQGSYTEDSHVAHRVLNGISPFFHQQLGGRHEDRSDRDLHIRIEKPTRGSDWRGGDGPDGGEAASVMVCPKAQYSWGTVERLVAAGRLQPGEHALEHEIRDGRRMPNIQIQRNQLAAQMKLGVIPRALLQYHRQPRSIAH